MKGFIVEKKSKLENLMDGFRRLEMDCPKTLDNSTTPGLDGAITRVLCLPGSQF